MRKNRKYFRIRNGYVEAPKASRQGLRNIHAIHPSTIPENTTATVKCSEGYTLDDPDANKLICRQAKWQYAGPPIKQCREVVCKRPPIISNARLLKRVSLKFIYIPDTLQGIIINKGVLMV